VQAGVGSITQRLGKDSQQPFGHCCLCLAPVEDAVVSPSGHIYEREVILEYLLTKTKELKKQAKQFEQQQEKEAIDERQKIQDASDAAVNKFVESVEGVATVVKRKASELEEKSRSEKQDGYEEREGRVSVMPYKSIVYVLFCLNCMDSYLESRKRVIDDTARTEKQQSLRQVAPWLPSFTPEAPAAAIKVRE
jgi:nitric oxide synthase-interacting protein